MSYSYFGEYIESIGTGTIGDNLVNWHDSMNNYNGMDEATDENESKLNMKVYEIVGDDANDWINTPTYSHDTLDEKFLISTYKTFNLAILNSISISTSSTPQENARIYDINKVMCFCSNFTNIMVLYGILIGSIHKFI